MEEQDDDVIVIVVEDDAEDNIDDFEHLLSPSQIKSEPIFSPEDEEFQELQHLFEKHGQYVKNEPLDYDDMEDYIPEEDVAGSSEEEPETVHRNRRRFYPNECRSLVQELRESSPKYNEEIELLNALINRMHSVKPPRLFGVYSTTEDGKFVCSICFAEKATSGDIERHYLAQHGPRYLSCYACGADFRCTTNLYKHEKRCIAPDADLVLKARALYIGNKARGRKPAEESGKRFQCDLCPATYVAKVSLVAHKRMHRAERPYVCDMCPRAYTSKSVLGKHRWTHSEANFVCDHCGRTFKYKTALASHVYTHFPPRFPCQECPKKFTYKSALLLHVHHIHRKLPPPCACQLCPKRFGRMWALKDHMKKVHGMQLMTRRMFFKQLPQMSKTDIEQAKIVLRSEVPILHPSDMMPIDVVKQDVELDFESGVLVGREVIMEEEEEEQ